MSDAGHVARDDGGSGRALGNGIRHHEHTARAWFHRRVRCARLDPYGTLTATLSDHLAGALPDPVERKEVTATIIQNANPRAYAVVIGPGRPIQHSDAATQQAILVAAESDFIEGISFSLATAIVFLALVLAAGFAWFPRGKGSIAGAEPIALE